MTFDLQFAIKLLPTMAKYMGVTLSLASLSILFGLTLAFFIALIINAKVKVLQQFFKIYISFFRGTPLVAQLFCLYFGLLPMMTSLTLRVSSFQAALIVMSLNSSAYMAESLRGAISSIDKGQMEASMAVGMTYFQAMTRIILPQAFRVALPTLCSSFINVIKDTSLTFYIGVKEMMATAQLEATSSYRYIEAFVDVLFIYWLLTSILGYISKRLESRTNHMVGEKR
ncbi:MAG: amino acid ABC transporter permease [Proteocatella sp.]